MSSIDNTLDKSHYLKKYLKRNASKRRKSSRKISKMGAGMRLIEDQPLYQIKNYSEQGSGDDADILLPLNNKSGKCFIEGSFVSVEKHGPTSSNQLKIKGRSDDSDTEISVRRSLTARPQTSDSTSSDSDQEILERRLPVSRTKSLQMSYKENQQLNRPIKREPKGGGVWSSRTKSERHRRIVEENVIQDKYHPKNNTDMEIKQETISENESDDIERPSRITGLMTLNEAREEAKKIKEHEKRQMNHSDELTGRYAQTVKRITGFKRSGKKKVDSAEEEARKLRESKKQAELEKKYELWNRGVSQLEMRDQQLKEIEETMGEKFSRYADDDKMNEYLKDQLHDEDPMAEFFKVKRHKVKLQSELVYPKYEGHFAPNRFGISPGYRWDGVDRSNGFESKIALAENKRQAQKAETYKAIAECGD